MLRMLLLLVVVVVVVTIILKMAVIMMKQEMMMLGDWSTSGRGDDDASANAVALFRVCAFGREVVLRGSCEVATSSLCAAQSCVLGRCLGLVGAGLVMFWMPAVSVTIRLALDSDDGDGDGDDNDDGRER